MITLGFAAVFSAGLIAGALDGEASKPTDPNRDREVSVRSLPLPIRIDRSYYVNSSLCLKCQVQEYEEPFGAFAKGRKPKAEEAFSDLVQALHRKDVETVRSMSDRQRLLRNKGVRVDQMVDGYAKMLDPRIVGADFSKLHIVAHIYAGTDRIFIWGIEGPSELSPNPVMRRAFRFVERDADRFSWDVSPPDTMISLLTDVMQHKAQDPEKFGIVKKREFRYEFPIPGTVGPHPVHIQFDGRVYDVDVLREPIPESDEVLAFYQKAYRAFVDDSPQAVGRFYTDMSRKKFEEWISRMKPEELAAFYRSVADGPRRVRFILDADPAFFVFYTTAKKGKDGPLAGIRYECIVRDEATGMLRLANFYFMDFVDHYLGDQELFLKPVLGSILAGAEATQQAALRR